MKKATLLASSLLLAGYIVFSSYQAGAALNGFVCTGGETDNGNAAGCTTGRGCHANTSTAGINVSITLDSAGGKATTHYVGGGSYTIVLKGTNTTNSTLPHFGFQLQARQMQALSELLLPILIWLLLDQIAWQLFLNKAPSCRPQREVVQPGLPIPFRYLGQLPQKVQVPSHFGLRSML